MKIGTEIRVMWSCAKECGQPLEAGKGKEWIDSPLGPPEEKQPY